MLYSKFINRDVGSYLLISIFDQVWALGYFWESPDEYIQKHRALLTGTCQILERLCLVEKNDRVALGFRPTNCLIDIILKRGLCSPKPTEKESSVEDDDVLNTLYD